MLSLDPASPVPIWKQIEQAAEVMTTSGALAPGDPLPSVRELARQLRVNPLTVSKAYRRLADRGLVIVRRGQGTFVADRPPILSEAERQASRRAAARTHALEARRLAADLAETTDLLHDVWNELETEINA
ncbi:MAG: GntR family transcriptional regulator [Acidobacteriota bacterium]